MDSALLSFPALSQSFKLFFVIYTDLSSPSSSSNFPNKGSGLNGSVEVGGQKMFLYIIPPFCRQDMNSRGLSAAASSASAPSRPSPRVVLPRAAECSLACWSLDFCVIGSHGTEFTRSNYTPWLQQGPFPWHGANLMAKSLPFSRGPTHLPMLLGFLSPLVGDLLVQEIN